MEKTLFSRRLAAGMLAALLGAFALPSAAPAADAAKPAIVLVHGAFADGSSWSAVIPILEKDGYRVTAVQMPLTTYAEDVAATRRVIADQPGPTVVVGHSYAGAVITEAAAGDPKVKALVYVAAFGPEAGEPVNAYLEKYPSKLGGALRPGNGGFLYIDRAQFGPVFAGDVPPAAGEVAAVTQKPIAAASFDAKPSKAAWKDIPSWYLVTTQDNAINPDLERFYAKRMNAKVTEVASSHVAFFSHPDVVARVIEQAAGAK